MPDARVIAIDGPRRSGTSGRGGSPTAGGRGAAADVVARGAARASGERSRRRRSTTPLISAGEAAPSPPGGHAPARAADPASAEVPSRGPGGRPRRRQADAPADGGAKASPTPSPRTASSPTRSSRSSSAPASRTPSSRSPSRTPSARSSSARRARTAAAREQHDEAVAALDDLGVAAADEGIELSRGGDAGPLPGAEDPSAWEHDVASALAFLRRRLTGDYHVDEFGFDAELTDTVLMAALRPLYRHWFRVDATGLDNVPAEGGALVVANHSGTVAMDSLMTQLALLDHHPARRSLRLLGADLVFKTPVVGEFARKNGATLACTEDAERLLRAGHLVGVWPEGFKGVGKPFRERYKLQRFGRGGFVAAALRTGVPIVPCSIVGAEEIYPIIGNLKTLARLLGVPYVPVTPTFPWLGPLGLVPLPSKWMIEFGEPIETAHHGGAAAEDPMLVFHLTDQVRETIQHTLYTLLMRRRSVFF